MEVIKGYDSNLEEVEASREDSYDDILLNAAAILDIPLSIEKLSLYRPNCAHTPNRELTVNSLKKKWTLGNYLMV